MKKTWLLGLGFFSISLSWGLYNAFVPLFLEDFITSVALIGFMMTIDNYFGLFLQPIIGRKSDKTDTRIGKRMPYLLIGIPLAAIFCILIPFYNNEALTSSIGQGISSIFGIVVETNPSFALLITFMVLMNLSMALYRSPTVSLMPDITVPEKRTKANGVINFMGGIGSIMAFAIGSFLYEIDITYPFIFTALVSLLVLIALLLFVNERRYSLHYQQQMNSGDVSERDIHTNMQQSVERAAVKLQKASKSLGKYRLEWTKPTIFLLLAIYFWFFSYQGIEALFTLYGTNNLNLTDSQASFSLTFFSLAFVAAAIPAGYLGNKYGKKPVIMFGVCGLIVMFAAAGFADSLLLLRILLLIGGIFWAMININSYPFVIALGKESSIGTRTGIYYIASSLAALSSPVLMGLVVDFLGYSSLFYVASGGMVVALVFLFQVKHDDIKTSSAINLQA